QASGAPRSGGSRPIITGVAAARLLGQDKGEPVTGAGSSTGEREADTSATERRRTVDAAGAANADAAGRAGGRSASTGKAGTGIDGPTSHIDRSTMPSGEMPDLGKVRHPAAAAETRRETESHARPPV